MIKLVVTTMLFGVAAFAETHVYRVERDVGSGITWLVGGDGVRRPVKILEVEEYDALTGRVERVWAQLNATDAGRKMLHGSEVAHEVDADRRVMVDVYADGYRHERVMSIKKDRALRVAEKSSSKNVLQPRPRGMSARQWEWRQRVQRAADAPPKTVTVEHDAATGKDEVVK